MFANWTVVKLNVSTLHYLISVQGEIFNYSNMLHTTFNKLDAICIIPKIDSNHGLVLHWILSSPCHGLHSSSKEFIVLGICFSLCIISHTENYTNPHYRSSRSEKQVDYLFLSILHRGRTSCAKGDARL